LKSKLFVCVDNDHDVSGSVSGSGCEDTLSQMLAVDPVTSKSPDPSVPGRDRELPRVVNWGYLGTFWK